MKDIFIGNLPNPDPVPEVNAAEEFKAEYDQLITGGFSKTKASNAAKVDTMFAITKETLSQTTVSSNNPRYHNMMRSNGQNLRYDSMGQQNVATLCAKNFWEPFSDDFYQGGGGKHWTPEDSILNALTNYFKPSIKEASDNSIGKLAGIYTLNKPIEEILSDLPMPQPIVQTLESALPEINRIMAFNHNREMERFGRMLLEGKLSQGDYDTIMKKKSIVPRIIYKKDEDNEYLYRQTEKGLVPDKRISQLLKEYGDTGILEMYRVYKDNLDAQLKAYSGYKLIVSRNPADLMRKSTCQTWGSCESVFGFNFQGTFADIKQGNAVVYLSKDDNPIWEGRLLARRCKYTKDGEVHDGVGFEPHIYGGLHTMRNIIYDTLLEKGKPLGLFDYGPTNPCVTDYVHAGWISVHGYNGMGNEINDNISYAIPDPRWYESINYTSGTQKKMMLQEIEKIIDKSWLKEIKNNYAELQKIEPIKEVNSRYWVNNGDKHQNVETKYVELKFQNGRLLPPTYEQYMQNIKDRIMGSRNSFYSILRGDTIGSVIYEEFKRYLPEERKQNAIEFNPTTTQNDLSSIKITDSTVSSMNDSTIALAHWYHYPEIVEKTKQLLLAHKLNIVYVITTHSALTNPKSEKMAARVQDVLNPIGAFRFDNPIFYENYSTKFTRFYNCINREIEKYDERKIKEVQAGQKTITGDSAITPKTEFVDAPETITRKCFEEELVKVFRHKGKWHGYDAATKMTLLNELIEEQVISVQQAEEVSNSSWDSIPAPLQREINKVAQSKGIRWIGGTNGIAAVKYMSLKDLVDYQEAYSDVDEYKISEICKTLQEYDTMYGTSFYNKCQQTSLPTL